MKCKRALVVMILAMVSVAGAAAQQAGPGAKPTPAPVPLDLAKLPALWHSDASHKDFRVVVKGDLFRADWVNIPAAAAKQGAYMRIECRRTGAKWMGSSIVYQGVAVPGAPAGAEVKMCRLTVRFVVESITPEKITFHSEVMREFDPAACRIQKTEWKEFTWVPKK
jgi:hypothetical protein